MRFAILLLVPLAATACGERCSDQQVGVGGACMPEVAAAGVPLHFQLREACGSPCDEHPRCEVRVDGGAVRLTAIQEICSEPAQLCVEACAHRVATCSIPALAEGSYALVVDGKTRATLRVADDGERDCFLGDYDGSGGFMEAGGAGGTGGRP